MKDFLIGEDNGDVTGKKLIVSRALGVVQLKDELVRDREFGGQQLLCCYYADFELALRR